MRFRHVAAAIAGMILLAVASFAQTAAIEGNVIGFDGKPLVGAVIKLNRTDIKQNYQTKTDKKGHFLYMGLPTGGSFQVQVEVDGKVVGEQSTRSSISNPQPVNIDLAKMKAEVEARQAAIDKAVQTGQLSDDMTKGMSAEQKEALKQREEALKKNAARNEAFQSGLTALEAKQWDQAVPALEKAGEIDPTQVAIWVNLADAYLGRSNTRTGADKEADVQKGIETYNKAIALKPDDAAIHNNYGRALANAKKYAEAQAEMAKAAQLDPPGAGKYYYNLGAILTNIGQAEPAVEAFKKAIEADPNYGDAYYQMGVSLMSKAQMSADGKITPAPGTVEALQKCIELTGKCQFAADAKALLETLGSTVETQYKDPNRKTTTKKK